ncbi:MAG TPA: hypothetical protein VK927_00910 [Adhaeribacter sp.]|nr:hypothetical protein [Adhaeribacter sp.]
MQENQENENDRPPFFQNWRSMYWLVLGALAGQIIVYYAITRFFE